MSISGVRSVFQLRAQKAHDSLQDVIDRIEQDLPGWRYSVNWYQGRVTERIRANVEAEKQAQNQANLDWLRHKLFGPAASAYDRYHALKNGGVNPLMALFDAAVLSPLVQYAPLALSFYQGFGGTSPFTGEQLSQGDRDFNKFMFLMEVVTLGEAAAANAGGKVAAKQVGANGIKWTSLDPPATRFVSEADGQFLKNLQQKYAGPTRQPAYAMQQPAGYLPHPLEKANYAQRNFGERFSKGNPFDWTTIDEVVDALRSGKLKPSDIPIDYIYRDGPIILNTRSAQALQRAGIPRAQWNAVNRTGEALFEGNLTEQLAWSELPQCGTPITKSRGK